MNNSFTSHNANKGGSSSTGTFNYLCKENVSINEHDLSLNNEHFFSNDFDALDNNGSNFTKLFCINEIDNNVSSSHKNNQSSYFILNTSPSKKELEHLENKADEILKERGLELESNSTEDFKKFYEEQKNITVDILLKDYINDLMEIYAENMNREIYVDVNNLPNESEYKNLNKEINEKFEEYLIEIGVKDKSDVKDKTFISIEKYKIKSEFEKGTIFSIYSDELNKNIDLFVSNNNFEINDNILNIEENYFIEKFENALYVEKEKEMNIEIFSTESEMKTPFKDYVDKSQIILKYDYLKLETNLNIYFDVNEIEIKDGVVEVGEKIYNNKLYDAKLNFLSKKFKEKKEEIFSRNLSNEGYDLTKIKDEKGKWVYQNPDKVPPNDVLKNIKLNSAVEFNNFLIEGNYIEERKLLTINDWKTKQNIKGTILGESDNAKLISISDERLKSDNSIWIPNSMLSNENGKIEVLSNFYENKITEILENEKDVKITFDDYSIFHKTEEVLIKNKESVKLSYDVKGLNKKVEFNINKEDLEEKEKGKYLIKNETFKIKYEKHLIEQAKKQYRNEYYEVLKEVHQSNKNKTQFQKDKIIEKNFKKILSEKGVLKDYYNDYFKVKANVVENKTNSSLISYKMSDDKEIRFWVNNKSINATGNNEISFKSEKEITKLIEAAEKRFTEQNKLVKIDFDNVDIIDQKKKEGEEKIAVFSIKHQGLESPIEIKFKLDEIKNEGEDYQVEKYKLDYKLEKAVKYSSSIEHQGKKDEIKNEVWREKGFNPEKRKVTRDDLKYFAKIENHRTYKSKNKYDYKFINENEQTQKKIDELLVQSKGKITKKVKSLEATLHRDKDTKEVIKEGVRKGGNNKHAHVVISKYDAKMPKHLKVSMSPTANQIDSKMPNGKQVGFNRDVFFEKAEKLFDKKFEFDRSYDHSYQYNNAVYKLKRVGKSITSPLVNEIVKEIKKEVKNPITQLKQEINPIGKLKQELKFVPLPTNIPKSKLDLLIKMGKFLIQTADKGMKM